jgi:hypothetical protein
MKFNEVLNTLSQDEAIQLASQQAEELGIQWGNGIKTILIACHSNPSLAPEIGTAADSKELTMNRWLKKYNAAFKRRPSVGVSNLPGTLADPIVTTIIKSRFPTLSEHHLDTINQAHRMSMSAENILGLLLEEYLADELAQANWHCAWGETIKHVDFCNTDGRLLQVKNRSNSENSSSSRVRIGTTIEKWYRIDARTCQYKWSELNSKCGLANLSEDSFVSFVQNCIKDNPAILAVEKEALWLGLE